MNVPALAARAPEGATYATTGIVEASRSWTIRRIDVSRPPGVSRRRTTSCACSRVARARPRCTYSAVAGPMTPVTFSATTGAGPAARIAGAASASAAISRNRTTPMAWRLSPGVAGRQFAATQNRPLAERGLRRGLREIERDFERLLELPIVSGERVLRRVVDLDFRIGAVILDGETDVREPERKLRLRRFAAVDELVPRVDADDAAPGTHAEQRPDLHQLEAVREDVAVGARVLVRQRDHRAGRRLHRIGLGLPPAREVVADASARHFLEQ